jgi:hypothetical protein
MVFILLSLQAALIAGVYSAYNKNKYQIYKQKHFWVVERGRCVRLTTSPPSVNRMPRQCGILNISLPCRLPNSVTGIALILYVDDVRT